MQWLYFLHEAQKLSEILTGGRVQLPHFLAALQYTAQTGTPISASLNQHPPKAAQFLHRSRAPVTGKSIFEGQAVTSKQLLPKFRKQFIHTKEKF